MDADLSSSTADLSHADAGRRAAAAQTLAGVGTAARVAAVPLVGCAGDENDTVREWAVAALEGLGPPPAEDATSLGELLSAGEDAAYWAATLLGRLRADAAPAVPQLIAALDGSVPASVRQRAAWALGGIGPRASAALEPLRHAAASDDPRLARLARRAIEQINAAG